MYLVKRRSSYGDQYFNATCGAFVDAQSDATRFPDTSLDLAVLKSDTHSARYVKLKPRTCAAPAVTETEPDNGQGPDDRYGQ